MNDTERNLRKSLDSIVALSKKERNMLSAFEALGAVIDDLKCELRSKDFRISELEEKLNEAKRRASDAKD